MCGVGVSRNLGLKPAVYTRHAPIRCSAAPHWLHATADAALKFISPASVQYDCPCSKEGVLGGKAYSLPSHRQHVAITLFIASELVIMPTAAGGKTVGHSIHFFSIAALPCRAEWLRAKSTENVECERDVEYPSKRCCHIAPPIPVHTISRHSPSSR